MTPRKAAPRDARYDSLGRIIPIHRYDTDPYTNWSQRPGVKAWVQQAACLYTDPEIFFPEKNRGRGRLTKGETAAAKVICARCPVKVECLEHALTVHEAGIRGGLTENERRGLRKRSRK